MIRVALRIGGVLLSIGVLSSVATAEPGRNHMTEKHMVEGVAVGSFEVSLKPVTGADPGIGSMSIEKVFRGDLMGSSVGQMLAIRTPQEGSAGYVAMEVVTVTLAGKHGTFALQHSGIMERGALSATISVIPDSATEALSGLTGNMASDAKHNYTFHYRLPE